MYKKNRSDRSAFSKGCQPRFFFTRTTIKIIVSANTSPAMPATSFVANSDMPTIFENIPKY